MPAARDFIRLDLSFWRAFRFTTINLHFGGSPRWGATNNPANIVLARDRRIDALLALDTASTTRWRTNHFSPGQLPDPATSGDAARATLKDFHQ